MKAVSSTEELIGEFQESLGDTVVLLLDLKHRQGITPANRRDIDDAVNRLQTIIREIPQLAESRESFKLVFEAIQKAIGVWRKIFR